MYILMSLLAIPTYAEDDSNSDYYYILYNSQRVDDSDMKSIKQYADQLGKTNEIILKDTSTFKTAVQIYEALKKDSNKRNDKLKGIQIIGSSVDVPSFDIHYKIQMEGGIEELGNFKSDFFYSTFKNDSTILKDKFSIFKAFAEEQDVRFIPEWTVSRLPLTKGEISKFIKKYNQYVDDIRKLGFVPLVNFSNPIFAEKEHTDDMSYFISERLDKEFQILNSNQYRLYGIQQGYYPVTTRVIGDNTKEALKAENAKGIMDLFINSHGEESSMARSFFESEDMKSKKTEPLLDSKYINHILSKNFFTLTTWTCLNAFDLGTNNILYEALANGLCVNAMGATDIISNNGVNCFASLEEMKQNNFYYFQYAYFKTLSQGYTRSDSFLSAQRAYAQEILKNTETSYSLVGNYQYNLHNLLTYHYLGLIEYDSIGESPVIQLSKVDNQNNPDNNSTNPVEENAKKGGEIKYWGKLEGPGFKIIGLRAFKHKNNITFFLEYESNIPRVFNLFEAPDGDKLMMNYMAMPSGKNVVEFTAPKDIMKDVDILTMRFDTDEEAGDRPSIYGLSFRAQQLFVNIKLYDIDVVLDDNILEFDVPPTSINGRTMVPLRIIFEALGAKVAWDGKTQTITGTKDNTVTVLKLNSKEAKVNGKIVLLDVAPVSINNRTLVPVRFISESLGANVDWDGTTKTVIITSVEE